MPIESINPPTHPTVKKLEYIYINVFAKELNPYSKQDKISFVNLITEKKFTRINPPKTIAKIEAVFLSTTVLRLYLILDIIINISNVTTNLNIIQKYKYTSDTISEEYEFKPYIVVEL